MQAFGERYATYKPDERAVVVALLSVIYKQTKHKAFGRLASDLGPLVMSLTPVITGGNAPALMVVAVAGEAPALAADLAKALGRAVWEAELAASVAALQG